MGRTITEIQAEWDQIADLRHRQIISGQDISYRKVLVPTMMDFIMDCDPSSVIDLGCGSGYLTQEIALLGGSIVGIDLSPKSIELARQHFTDHENVAFEVMLIEDLPKQQLGPFTTGVANMTFMTALDLDSVVKAVARVLIPGGMLIGAITHPCFWPLYWGYDKESWFQYEHEVLVEAPFRISTSITDIVTTHIHRPLERYLNAFSEAGFEIMDLIEPRPDEEVLKLYPSGAWHWPHFLAFKLRLKAT